jgi:isoamylase
MHMVESYQVEPGLPAPFGVTLYPEGVNFALYSKHANEVILCLFDYDTMNLLCEIPFDSSSNKTGDVWHGLIRALPQRVCYGYRLNKSKGNLYRRYFNQGHMIVDPYAKALKTPQEWGERESNYQPLGVVDTTNIFDWEGDKPLNLPAKDLVIYEMHVRGFTQHHSSNTPHKGTFLGLIDKIPYLLDLGVNAVELLPVFEFNESEYGRYNPLTGERLCNYWGYSTVHFFSPMNRYATGSDVGQGLFEFKQMVKELHRNGIEVILDVVFNHTAEGNEEGPIYSFKGIDCGSYYILDQKHKHQNFSGCGNTFNSNHPIARDFIKSCLQYWVTEMHVDGFRFDLASVFMRGYHGEPLNKPPILDELTHDPILANTKLIAEPWDAGGLYNLGDFSPTSNRWSEWNDKYRDSVRRFIKGDRGEKRLFAIRICGSDDIFGHDLSPTRSINFVTSHDGFTLNDLVSYHTKDNTTNAENDRDGNPNNISWNCGVEGETQQSSVIALRERQKRNFHLALMISQGIPMLVMGDEYGHSRNGNNNSWCQDNEINWLNWDKLKKKSGFYRFYKQLIHFRRNHEVLHLDRYLSDEDIDWHGTEPFQPDWEGDSQFLACALKAVNSGYQLYIAFNMHHQEIQCRIPVYEGNGKWKVIVNTSNASPKDYIEEAKAPEAAEFITMHPHSAILLKQLYKG